MAVFFIVSIFASVIGAICGIGGGIIIKPILDSLGVLSVSTVSFLSSCTVLSMSTYSVVSGNVNKESKVEKRLCFPLAIGSIAGGIAGKEAFTYILENSADKNRVGLIQAVCMVIVTLLTLIYTLMKDKLVTLHFHNAVICVIIGALLGMMSSFLGIGGGPVNIVVLSYFFSMNTKTAAESSLYIIMFSQLSSILKSLLFRQIPPFTMIVLVLMVIGGIFGGVMGKRINKHISPVVVDKLFIILMIALILLNNYNIYKYIQ